jgi:hypothetical protein
MSTPANQLPAPMLDPSQYPSYLEAQRKQQIAQMLMGAFQNSANSPNPQAASVGPYTVQARRSPLQNIAPLVTALMAGKASKDATTAQQQYYQGLYGGDQQQPAAAAPPSQGAPASTGPGSGIISPTAPPAAQAAAQAVTQGGVTAPAPVPQAPRQNPLIPPGMTPSSAQAMLNMMGPETYAKTFLAPQYQQPEIVAQLRASGIDPSSPQGHAIQQSIIGKAATNVQDVRPGSTLFDVNQRNPLFTGPDNGVNTTWQNGQPSMATIPGALESSQAGAAAKTAGTQSQMPIKLGTDADGRDIYGFPAPPGPGRSATATGAPNATAPGLTASPATVTSQESGAKAGQDYASELAKNATGATEVRRSISELKNLSAQATPGAANEAKAKLGAFMIAAGADPDNVAKWTGVDTGALQAAQKQTATLAVNSIHSMTSRGTNFDLDTFMKNNPNMNMADPAAFARVADYMNNKAGQDIAKQKDFAQWKKTSGVTPDDWETQHTAHWLEQQNSAINQGHSNSAVLGAPVTNLSALQAEARRRGLIQ